MLYWWSMTLTFAKRGVFFKILAELDAVITIFPNVIYFEGCQIKLDFNHAVSDLDNYFFCIENK